MSSQKKYSYRLLPTDDSNRSLTNAFSRGVKLTLWEGGNVNKKVSVDYKFKPSNNSFSVYLEIDDRTLPSEWKFASLLFHVHDEGFSYLGKGLSEKKGELQLLTLDPEVYVLEKRRFFRLGVWGKHPISMRVKFLNPPLLIKNMSHEKVVSLFSSGDVSNIWVSFLELVKKITSNDESNHEVYVNFPIIDLSVSGVAIPATFEESKFFETLGTLSNAATIYFPNESIDIPKINYVHSTPWNYEGADGRSKAGFDFADDVWVRKQLEVKLKSYTSNVEDGFDKFLQ